MHDDLIMREMDLATADATPQDEKLFLETSVAQKHKRYLQWAAFCTFGVCAIGFMLFTMYLICSVLQQLDFDSQNKQHYSAEKEFIAKVQPTATQENQPSRDATNTQASSSPMQEDNLPLKRLEFLKSAMPYYAGFVLLCGTFALTLSIALIKYSFKGQSTEDTHLDSLPITPTARIIAELLNAAFRKIKKSN